jgi:hypothetical protein
MGTRRNILDFRRRKVVFDRVKGGGFVIDLGLPPPSTFATPTPPATSSRTHHTSSHVLAEHKSLLSPHPPAPHASPRQLSIRVPLSPQLEREAAAYSPTRNLLLSPRSKLAALQQAKTSSQLHTPPPPSHSSTAPNAANSQAKVSPRRKLALERKKHFASVHVQGMTGLEVIREFRRKVINIQRVWR